MLLPATTGLLLSSFDYEVSAQTEIAAEVEEPGKILVSGSLLAEIASKLPNAPVQLSTEESRIIIMSNRVIKDMEIAKRRAPKGGEPAWRRLERRMEQQHTAELISDFEDYDIGDGQPHRAARKAKIAR